MPFLRPGNEENGYTKNTTVVPVYTVHLQANKLAKKEWHIRI